jgi:hypothetical protein
MMKFYQYIQSGNDRWGQRWTLWHVGNYQYEIECRSVKKKIVLNDTFFKDAIGRFVSVLENGR